MATPESVSGAAAAIAAPAEDTGAASPSFIEDPLGSVASSISSAGEVAARLAAAAEDAITSATTAADALSASATAATRPQPQPPQPQLAKSARQQQLSRLPGIGLYIRSILTRKVPLPFKVIGSNVQELLTRSLVQTMEGKCAAEGFIKRNSIRIINYSAGVIESDKIIFQVLFECLVCNPVEGFGFKAVARNITKAGVRATTDEDESPVVVFLSKEHHLHRDDFGDIKPDDVINVRVIGTRFELNDPYISVIAEFVSFKKLDDGAGVGTGAGAGATRRRQPRLKIRR